MTLFDTKFLFASLLWGSIGVGYFIYGRKQRELAPFLGGLALIAVSYLVGSALLMSIICVALIIGIHMVLRRG